MPVVTGIDLILVSSYGGERMKNGLGLYAVFGHPIAHSLSPIIHQAAFNYQHMSSHYIPVDCGEDRLQEKLAAFWELGGQGANLTRPLKEVIVPLLTDPDEWVLRAGAANTIIRTDSGIKGYNTDCQALFHLLGPARPGAKALILGGGGVARASYAVLYAKGYDVTIATRRGQPLAWALSVIPWADRLALGDWDVVVNATPLGQAGELSEAQWPVPNPQGVAVEWVYRPRRTPFVEQASQVPCHIIDGLSLFVEQAAWAWSRWFDEDPPRNVMWKAVKPWC